MADFCKKCFIEQLHPTEKEIKSIVLSEENGFCESCNEFKPVVEYLKEVKE